MARRCSPITAKMGRARCPRRVGRRAEANPPYLGTLFHGSLQDVSRFGLHRARTPSGCWPRDQGAPPDSSGSTEGLGKHAPLRLRGGRVRDGGRPLNAMRPRWSALEDGVTRVHRTERSTHRGRLSVAAGCSEGADGPSFGAAPWASFASARDSAARTFCGSSPRSTRASAATTRTG